jgi:hypothetical protein
VNRRRCHGEGGVAALEAVIVMPIAMIVLLFTVQACLWAHADTVVGFAASQGVRQATLAGGSTAAGIREAHSTLAATANSIVVDPRVQTRPLPDGRIDLVVSGYAESLLPGLRLPVSAERIGVVQQFRPDR